LLTSASTFGHAANADWMSRAAPPRWRDRQQRDAPSLLLDHGAKLPRLGLAGMVMDQNMPAGRGETAGNLRAYPPRRAGDEDAFHAAFPVAMIP
jgi:hypothetical protein